MRSVGVGSIRALPALLALALVASAAGEVELRIPEGVLPPMVPEDNPLTPAKVDLGRKLYFDVRLSKLGNISCATCHSPASAFADPRATKTSAGGEGRFGPRNAPTSLNATFLSEQFWDGRAPTLEAQAVLPFINPIEMGVADHPSLERLVAGLPEYPPLFRAAFGGDEVTVDRIGKAIASFERTLVSLSAPIDRYLAGEETAVSESARRGWELFNGKARCNTCHGWIEVFPLFTDELYHNLGVGTREVDFDALAKRALAASGSSAAFDELALDPNAPALGRFAVTREPKDIGAFKTPQLRNVALTAPYMHDGSEATLADVIAFYDRGGEPNAYLDGGMRPLGLTRQEQADLVELMKTFTSHDLDRFQDLARLMPD